MEVGIIGLGKMGENMGVRLLRGGHTVYGSDLSPEMRELAEAMTPPGGSKTCCSWS